MPRASRYNGTLNFLFKFLNMPRVMNYFLPYVALILTVSNLAAAFQSFQDDIPNGASIPNPCNRNKTWKGLGHEHPEGAGVRNPFGRDFDAGGKTWTVSLCRHDSDGDGRSNGEELGDPKCVWTIGAEPTITDLSQLSHPGICEPIDAPNCAHLNSFLSTVDGCATTTPTQNKTLAGTSTWCPAIEAPDVKSVTLRFDKTLVPANETTYLCQQFSVPNDQDYHIIAWEPVISNVDLVYGLTVFLCDSKSQEAALKASGAYAKPSDCPLMPMECRSVSVVWTPGLLSRCYDEVTGLLMGGSSYHKVILQVLYNNQQLRHDVVDASGIKLYYTAKKRQYDLAMLAVGQFDIALPPHSSRLTRVLAKSFQSTNCSNQQLSPYPTYNITSVSFHMRQLGTHAKLTIKKRNGLVIPIIDEQVDRPKLLIWTSSTAIEIEPGDNFEIECGYRSPDRDQWTFFGEKASDEMCVAYFNVYPRPQYLNFVSFTNFGKVDVCTLHKSVIDGCPVAEFQSNVTLLDSDLMTFCNDPELGYPATSCSYTCYAFLERKELLGNPCLRGSVFSLVAVGVGGTISNHIEDSYRIRSQAERCMTLKKAPPMSQKDRLIANAVAERANSKRSFAGDDARQTKGLKIGVTILVISLGMLFK